MTVRARVRAWWRGPGLAVPTLGGPEQRPSKRPAPGHAAARSNDSGPPNGLAALFGHTRGVRVIVQSPSGLDIPIAQAAGWTVLDVAAYLAAVDALPTTEPGSWRA